MTEIESQENQETNVTKETVSSSLENAIIRQLEYYFGDANLARDKFMLEQISKDDGWVAVSVLLTFNRLAKLSTEPDVIVNAIEKSEEGLIEISEDRLKLRRHPERPIPEQNEERRKEVCSRTAYAKGFPLETEMVDIIDYFNAYEKVLNIMMRKYLDKATKQYKFKGSIFVTFATKEQCGDFIDKEKVDFNGNELLRKWQEKYYEEKKQERDNKKRPKDDERKKKNATEEYKIKLPKGAIIYFEGADEESTSREHIRETLESLGGEVSYIEYSKGDKTGYIRLTNENSAQPLVEKCDENKMKLKNTEVVLTLRVLEGEEEEQFIEKAINLMKSRRTNHKSKSGNKYQQNNRKRRGDRNRNGTSDDGELPFKK